MPSTYNYQYPIKEVSRLLKQNLEDGISEQTVKGFLVHNNIGSENLYAITEHFMSIANVGGIDGLRVEGAINKIDYELLFFVGSASEKPTVT